MTDPRGGWPLQAWTPDAEELYEQAPCGYLTADADGVVSRVNATLLRWLGRRGGEVVGRRMADLLTVGGQIYYETHYEPLLFMQGRVREIAFEMVRGDGEWLPVFVNSTLRRDEAGRPLAILTSVFDASERRSYERELLAARDRERAFRERAERLQRIASRVAAAADVQVIAHAVLDDVVPTVGATRAGFALTGPGGGELRPLAWLGPPLATVPQDLDGGGEVVQDGEVVYVHRLEAGGRAGVLWHARPREVELSDVDRAFVATCAALAGQSIGRALLQEQTAHRGWQSSVLADVSFELEQVHGLQRRANRLVELLVACIGGAARVEVWGAAGRVAAVEHRPRGGRAVLGAAGKVAADAGAVRLPLRAGGRQLGWLTVTLGGPACPEAAGGLGFLAEIADRAAHAFDDARLLEEEHTVALALQASERRQRLLLSLSDALSSLEEPEEIQAQAARLLGEELGASRTFFLEPASAQAAEGWLIGPNHCAAEMASLAGPLPPVALGIAVESAAAAGRRWVVSDAAGELGLSDQQRAALRALGVDAHVVVARVKQDRLVGAVAVQQDRVRRWSEHEVQLVEETAERTWLAVERARSEQALAASRALMHKALSTQIVGVVFARLDGAVSEVNETFESMSGWRRQHLRDGARWPMMVASGSRAAADRAAVDLAVCGETAPQELELLRPDGSRWWGLVAPTRISGRGSQAECVAFIIDITQAKADAAAAARERERREHLEREFIANAAHELRTPLTGIIGAVGALEAGAKDDPAERERFLNHLGHEARRLARLSDSLLLLARAGSAGTMPRGTVAVHALLSLVAAGLAPADGVAISVRAPHALSVEANEGLLEVVLDNLAANAVKHTRQGRIELRARRRRRGVVIEVADTGLGMPAAQLERAFDRFYRSEPRAADGFGLGLSIARQAADAIGANLSLHSTAGKGTLARLVIPDEPV